LFVIFFMMIAIPLLLAASRGKSGIRFASVAGTIKSLNLSQVAERKGQMAASGLDWRELSEEETKLQFTGSSIVSMLRLGGLGWYQSRVLGSLDMTIDGHIIRAYDWLFSRRRPKGVMQSGFQTVVTARPAMPVDLPHFYLRPRKIVTISLGGMSIATGGSHDGISCYESVDLLTMIPGDYTLESTIPYRACILFDTPYGREEFSQFISDRDWTVEWTGEQLVVYTRNLLVDPADLDELIGNVVQLVEMQPHAEAAVDRAFDQRIEVALQGS